MYFELWRQFEHFLLHLGECGSDGVRKGIPGGREAVCSFEEPAHWDIIRVWGGIEAALRREADAQGNVYGSEDLKEGVLALQERRKPDFKGQ